MDVAIVQPYKIYKSIHKKNVKRVVLCVYIIINVLNKTIYSVTFFRSEQIEGHEFHTFFI